MASKEYQTVPLLDEEDRSFSDKGLWRRMSFDGETWSRGVRRITDNWMWVGHAILLSLSMTLFTLSFCMRYGKPSDLVVTQQFSSYSPAAPVVRYEMQRYNLTPNMEWSKYVGYGPAVDEEWDRISDIGDMMINESELKLLGLPPESIKVTSPYTGVEGYRAAIEVFHQLHCLNLLRQYTFKEYYLKFQGDISDDTMDVRGHVDHCIETLRLNLMCQADIGIFTFHDYEEMGPNDPWPDFSTLHVCRNFDDIREWAMKAAVAWDHDV